MKRMRKLSAVCLALCLLSGCGAVRGAEPETETSSMTETATVETTEAATEETTETTTAAVPKDLPPVDVDLTQLSQNLMYSQAYDMLYNSEQYIGKSVRIAGPYNAYTDPETNVLHRACLIRDATACCTQGIEFETADETQPMPDAEQTIIVSGVFDTYMTGPFLYCVLRDATIES